MTVINANIVVRWSDRDEIKADPELVCDVCKTVLCDVEHGDSLQVLASVAADHDCPVRFDVPEATAEPAPAACPKCGGTAGAHRPYRVSAGISIPCPRDRKTPYPTTTKEN